MAYYFKQFKKKFPNHEISKRKDIPDYSLVYFDGKKIVVSKKGEHLIAWNTHKKIK